jgi:hypothetical protein
VEPSGHPARSQQADRPRPPGPRRGRPIKAVTLTELGAAALRNDARAPTPGAGAWAELVVSTEQALTCKPDGVDTARAGAAAWSEITAVLLVDALDLSAGDTVLIVGGTGGVGSLAAQLAAAAGATVGARPDPTEVSAFIDEHRARFGVEPICRTLGVSASAYYQRATGERSAREIADEQLLERIRQVHAANYEAYGYRRMWKALLRAGERVPRCQVQRLMREHGIRGAKRRGRPWRTTIADRTPNGRRISSSATSPPRGRIACEYATSRGRAAGTASSTSRS